MRSYEYRTRNESALSPVFEKQLAEPLANKLSDKISLNLITVLGHFAIYLALFISYYSPFSLYANFLMVTGLLVFQIVCDKVDGVKARMSGRASALGEFLDHFFELFNQGALLLIVLNFYTISHEWLVLALMATACLVNMTKYYEQYKTSILVKKKISFLELKAILVVVFLASSNEGIYVFFDVPDVSSYSFIEAGMIVVLVGVVFNLIANIIRTPNITYGGWMFIVLFVAVGFITYLSFGLLVALVVLLFYGVLYVGRLLLTQLGDGVERSPDLFLPIFLTVHYFSSFFKPNYTIFILSVYLLVNIILLLVKAIKTLSVGEVETVTDVKE